LRASVLIVEYATRQYLPACLSALEASTLPREQFEVIVVDNASPTPVADIAGRFPGVRFLKSRRNLGFAGGNLLGLGYARGEHVALLNPDAIAAPDWLVQVLRPFSDPAVGIVGSKILHPDTSVLQHAGGVLMPNGRSEHRGRGEHDVGQYDTPSEADYVCGAAIAVRREVIERVGFLSPAYFPAYYEETELCVRARRAGFKVMYAPSAVVEHHETVASGDARASAYLARYHENRVRFVLRNYSRAELLRRFLPAEAAYLFRNCPPSERRICLRAYVDAWRTAWDTSRGEPRPGMVVDDSWGSRS
jgi:GT2 family glycosyltransferase